ncbi:MAG: DoxX family protein [Deltaproteobacteria bacterium]|nr:DoxX family membrane protein [Deltaproteobacteria bacterium]RLB50204.1 MAG: DoxX family protein [Deltaproteobacteria bacterium]
MKFAVIGARVLLGLIFTVFGLHGFFHFSFIPMPEMSEAGGTFMGVLMGTGYFMIVVKVVEVLAGLMILTGRFLPLGLILLAPVTVNILLFHIFLDPAGMGMAIFIIAMQLFLAWSYRDSYSGVLQANPTPAGQS